MSLNTFCNHFKIIVILLFTVSLALTFNPTSANSNDSKEFNVITDVGNPLTCKNLKYGYRKIISEGKKALGGSDSHGNFFQIASESTYEFIETSEIKLAPDNNFGIAFELSQLEKNDSLTLDVVVFFPKPVDIKGKMETSISCQYKYWDRSKKDQYIVWSFKENEKQYYLKGNWRMEVRHKEKQILTKTFVVK